jgi:LysM repeat protein
MAEPALRLGTHVLFIALILVIGWIMREFYSSAQVNPVTSQGEAALAAALPTPTPAEVMPELPAFTIADPSTGIERTVFLTTTLMARPREDVLVYTVEQGDTLFGIAERFGLKPETLLWGNQLVLGDNPHNLRPGQELNILPVNGTYYRWAAGDGLNGVAKFFGVTPEDIINYPGNHLNPDQIGDFANPNIEPGVWSITPGWQKCWVLGRADRLWMAPWEWVASSGRRTTIFSPVSITRHPPIIAASISMETPAMRSTRRTMEW